MFIVCRMSYQQFINHLTAVHNIIFSCEIITFLKRLSDNQGIFVLNFAALSICPNTFHHFYSTDMQKAPSIILSQPPYIFLVHFIVACQNFDLSSLQLSSLFFRVQPSNMSVLDHKYMKKNLYKDRNGEISIRAH